jgi:uncharacterized protein YegP (UPF0339 family)
VSYRPFKFSSQPRLLNRETSIVGDEPLAVEEKVTHVKVHPDQAVIFTRADGKLDWHLVTPNHEVLYGSMQGYENMEDVLAAIHRYHPDVAVRHPED